MDAAERYTRTDDYAERHPGVTVWDIDVIDESEVSFRVEENTMAFMIQDITDWQTWYETDTVTDGVCYIPAKYFTREQAAEVMGVETGDVTTVEGFGARLSAPGYLDCTEWCVFDTKDEAKAYLEEMYGDEDEDTV